MLRQMTSCSERVKWLEPIKMYWLTLDSPQMAWWFLFCSWKHFLFCREALHESSRLALKKRNWKTIQAYLVTQCTLETSCYSWGFNITGRKVPWLLVAAVEFHKESPETTSEFSGDVPHDLGKNFPPWKICQVLPGLAPSTPAPILRPLRVEIETLKAEVCLDGVGYQSLPQKFCKCLGVDDWWQWMTIGVSISTVGWWMLGTGTSWGGPTLGLGAVRCDFVGGVLVKVKALAVQVEVQWSLQYLVLAGYLLQAFCT